MDDDQPESPDPVGDRVPPPQPAGARPGGSIFTIEGRAAPGLFVVGWLASILGLGFLVVGALGGSRLFFLLLGPGLLALGLIAGCGSQAIERRARAEAYAGPSPWLVFAAVVATARFIAVVVGAGLQAMITSVGASPEGPLGQLISAILTAAIFLGLIRLTVVGSGGLSWREMGLRRFDRLAASDLALGAATALPVVAVTWIVAAILIAIFGVISPSPLPATGQVSGFLLQLVVGAVIAPIAEEIFFRGFALTAWQRRLGPNRAIVRATILFTLAHVVDVQGSDFLNALALVAVGAGTRVPVALALGWLYVRRGSLWAPIGLHATFNAVLLVIANIALSARPPG
jgi:membrane protease YdiL (CAAX protease family)